MSQLKPLVLLTTAAFSLTTAAAAAGGQPRKPSPMQAIPRLALEPDPEARFRFSGVLGERIANNTREWLIPAPKSNPGMIGMFHVRDRQPRPELVPWAGEFAGKHLISMVQALRQHEDPALKTASRDLVRDLLASQAEDGYLGPFTKGERLKGHWDLWGHYHCMLGLILWHEQTGDEAAVRGARRAADLICSTFLDTGLRVFDAGSQEMNMAAIHVMARLHRMTGEPRYLRMAREIEKDWERAGDYLRTGLAGEEFFRTPRPRWESLPDIQGMVELYQITGDARYRLAFEQHWRSILRWDRRNTGGFSSGEQATGDPYAPTAIETCCTIAWMALTVDMLRLSGDPLAADELELSTYNAAAGAQHPSGRWWTYNTPMDGAREASAHTIVFQARPGTPELNCCSVNGPRSLGMLSEWGVMRDGEGLTINAYAPGRFTGKTADGAPVTLEWETDYPRSGRVAIRVKGKETSRFPMRLRIPGWSKDTQVAVNGKAVADVRPGSYLRLDRRWAPGDRIQLDLDMSLRFVAGAREAEGKVSLYRGPLLLAYDQADNTFDEDKLPAIDVARLGEAKVIDAGERRWVALDLPAMGGGVVRVRDFASAGSSGTRYRSWLSTSTPLPAPAVSRTPRDRARIPAGRALFRWTGAAAPGPTLTEYRLIIAEDAKLERRVAEIPGIKTNWLIADEEMKRLVPAKSYWWSVTAINRNGAAPGAGPAVHFAIDPTLPRLTDEQLRPPSATGVLLSARLSGAAQPQTGELLAADGQRPAEGPDGRANGAVALDGISGRLKYALDSFPEEDYAVAVRVKIHALPEGRMGQVFSAWSAPQDDPLRLTVQDGKLFARIEAGGGGASTEGFPIRTETWYSLVAVKEGASLLLYVNGKVVGRAVAPYAVCSNSREVALGGNPRFAGPEFLSASFADFSLHAGALTPEQLSTLIAR